jgi:hypothetical protein
MRTLPFAIAAMSVAIAVSMPPSQAVAQASFNPAYTVLVIKPSQTDSKIVASDVPSFVVYDRGAKAGNILLFLTGTGGKPPGPLLFLDDAASHGYRVIALSYIDTPAVAQVCIGAAVISDPDCAAHFRQKRIYGTNATAIIGDAPQDSIVNRFGKLLGYLATTDRQGGWKRYLNGDAPVWTRVAVAGQSQGGGMAEFIAQQQLVARVISFSGGWDISPGGGLAAWYSGERVTPADVWYGTYNVAEPRAAFLKRTYAALGIPASHTFALNLPVRAGMEPHPEGVSNPAYKDVWDQLLGNGAL